MCVYVYVYIGGGFYAPATTSCFEFLSSVVDAVRQRAQAGDHDHDRNRNDNDSFAKFVPSYTLAPHAQYPTQLRQRLEALQYVLSTGGGRRPPPRLSHNRTLGKFCFSPSWPSMTLNKRKDLVTSVPTTQKLEILPRRRRPAGTTTMNPCEADAEWWGDVPRHQSPFHLGRGDEIMLDGQRAFVEKFTVGSIKHL
jgi:hypothetical protein